MLTGAAGFIGAGVARKLLQSGVKVVGIDNLSNYYDPELKRYRVQPLMKDKGFVFHESDITDEEGMDSIFKSASYSAVIHLAGMAGIRYSKDHPLEFEKTNVGGTAVLLECMHRFRVPTIVFASSSSVYSGNVPPYSEEMRTDTPASVYAATKKSAETLIHSYHKLFCLNAAILRYFSVYGPQGRPDMSYFRFINAIEDDKPIEIFGDGKQKRDFTYIDDIVAGTFKALQVEGFHTYNLGGGSSHSVNELIEQIESGMSKKAVKRFSDPDISDIPASSANIENARTLLHWAPTVSFEQGIQATIAWHRTNRELIRRLRHE